MSLFELLSILLSNWRVSLDLFLYDEETFVLYGCFVVVKLLADKFKEVLSVLLDVVSDRLTTPGDFVPDMSLFEVVCDVFDLSLTFMSWVFREVFLLLFLIFLQEENLDPLEPGYVVLGVRFIRAELVSMN